MLEPLSAINFSSIYDKSNLGLLNLFIDRVHGHFGLWFKLPLLPRLPLRAS